MMAWIHLFLMLLSCQSVVRGQGSNTNQAEAQATVDEFNKRVVTFANDYATKVYNYYNNITNHTRELYNNASNMFTTARQGYARNLLRFNTTHFPDKLKRAMRLIITELGEAAQTNSSKAKRLSDVLSSMQTIHDNGNVCLTGDDKCLIYDPDLLNLFKTSRNYSILLEAWKQYRDNTGKKMKNFYEEFVSLSNEAYAISGYADTGEGWRDRFETDNIEAEMDKLYQKLLPFYEKLHAFVRNKLKNIYGANAFPKSGHIPAHLLGDIYGQEWQFIKNDIIPYADVDLIDITAELVRQNYTAKKIVRTAEDFFTSLGFEKMPPKFWAHSLLERPKDNRSVNCWPKAFDMHSKAKDDFRIMECVTPNHYHFETVHHEMGHIVNFMQYRHLPYVFRFTSLVGFHEAVGDSISLSALTPDHLRKIKLLGKPQKGHDQKKADINHLMSTALSKLPLLRYAYIIDKWRWSVFKGTTKPADYNKYWWYLRCKHQGVSPPIKRESSDFDLGALYHIPYNYDYVRLYCPVSIPQGSL